MRRVIAIVFVLTTVAAGAAATEAWLAEGTVNTPIHMLDVGPDGYIELDAESISGADFIIVEVRSDTGDEVRAKLMEGQTWVINLAGVDRARVQVACPFDVATCDYRLRDVSTDLAEDLDPDRATVVATPTTATTTTTVAPSATTTTTLAGTAEPVETAVVLVSDAPDRSDPVPLDGLTVSGDVYVFADLPASEAPVTFSIDGRRIQTERYLPFDAAGGSKAAADALDTTVLSDGVHSLRMVSENEDIEVAFTVSNDQAGEPSATTTEPPVTTTTEPQVTTTTAPATTTTTAPAATTSAKDAGSTRLVIDRDTTVVNGLVLRPGDSIEFRNGARLIFANGGYADWQGTPTWTWSDDGRRMNLERDIEVFGEGHVMFHAGSAPSTIRFVEFDLQPNEELGHYPLHWHLVGDDSRGTLVEGTVVKHSTNRAYVPHGSHGITFRDTIAYDIVGSAYWWDPPVFQGGPDENNSDDIVYERALAHTVTNHWSDGRGFRLAAFTMSAGRNNVVRDSVARNVEPSHVKDCAGFGWPELSHRQERVWTFTDNATFESDCHGTFVWQNGREVTHVVDGFRGDRISHGAYVNDYLYRGVDVEGVVIHAVGWRVEGGRVGDVVATRSQFEGSVVFDDVTVDSLTIDNTGGEAVHYVFRDATGVRCEDVVLRTAVSGTQVTINDRTCGPDDYTAPSASGTRGSSTSSGSGGAGSQPTGAPFFDVGPDHLFATSIEWMAEAGITRGCNPPHDTLFCPDSSVTRGQFAAFARRALALPPSSVDHFSDDDDSVFEEDINALARAGVTSGCGVGRFCPDERLTRGEMAAFFDRMLDLPDTSTDHFVDDRGSPFESSINALAAAGITKGCNPPANDRYCDGDSVSRGQLSAFLHRARSLF